MDNFLLIHHIYNFFIDKLLKKLVIKILYIVKKEFIKVILERQKLVTFRFISFLLYNRTLINIELIF